MRYQTEEKSAIDIGLGMDEDMRTRTGERMMTDEEGRMKPKPRKTKTYMTPPIEIMAKCLDFN